MKLIQLIRTCCRCVIDSPRALSFLTAIRCRTTSLLVAVVLLPLTGCQAPKVNEEQVARAAKDWCMTIRGSQVLPVYPLTEDILPGDLYLVQSTIQGEQREYKERGFLRLPEQLARLHPQGVEDFYLSSHGTSGRTDPPYYWRFDSTNGTNNLKLMPRVGFPTYQFSTRRGAGLNVAVPISGIPVAMNLVGSSSVDGSVVLSDAYTYAVDRISLQNQVKEWADENAPFLKAYKSTYDRTNYVRVINRIYLVGAVNVQVTSASSFAGALSGGDEKSVNLPNLTGTNTVQNYTNGIASLTSSLTNAISAPGGTIKVASASSRSVSLNQTFPRPLVVGYLGFDFMIDENGDLRFPTDTKTRLQGKATPEQGVLSYSPDVNTVTLRTWLKRDPANVAAAKEWLGSNAKEANLANVLTASELTTVRRKMVEALVLKSEKK